MMSIYLDSSEANSATIGVSQDRLRVTFDPPMSATEIGIEKLTLSNVRIPNSAVSVYLCCDITRPNLYNGRSSPVVFSVAKAARTTEWRDKLSTWYADNIIMYPVWEGEHTCMNLWLMDSNCRVLRFDYMAVGMRLKK